MRLSAKLEYSLKALLVLARFYVSKRPVSMTEIANEQNISSKFLLQLMTCMKNAKMIASLRGSSGGYYLLKSPSDVLIKDVAEALDDGIVATTLEQARELTIQEHVIVAYWDELNCEIERKLKDVSIQDLLDQSCKEGAWTYSI